MAMELVVIHGVESDRDKVFTFPSSDEPLLLGRSRANDFKLKDLRCSRSQCQLQLQGNRVLVRDSNSSGGTFINEIKISEHHLNPGDILRVGETLLRLQGTNSGELPPPGMSTLDLLSLKGQKVEHFEVGDYIGLGRSGVVFRAVDTDDGKPVALKIFKPEVVHGEEIIQRFIRAMTTMLPLTHPNLVRLYGAGKSGPLCWMSMEFVEGEDMTQVIDKIGRDGMLGWQYALRVAVHIGRALEYAQTHQVIHRNISPTNIILRSQDNTLKLGDMMLAKALENSEEQITAIGQVVGDPRYMAPERTYENVPIDGRADIYGLGATVYALLTGKPPFEGESVSATIKMLRNNPPIPPGEYQQSIPKAMESIVLRMLAKKPEHRFQTPTEMLQALTNMAAQHDMRV